MPADPFPKEPELAALEMKWFERRDGFRRSAPSMLFHCTGSLAGLVGIAESKQIWSTDVRFLNDRAELQHGLDIVAALVEARESGECEIARRLLEFIAAQVANGFGMFRIFVFCLCQESDLANQWFMYADEGRGFELGFDLGPPGGRHGLILRDGSTQQTPFALEPVIYSDAAKREQLDEVIAETMSAVQAIPIPTSPAATEDLVRRVGSMACAELYQRCAVVKHSSFRNEYEWRLTYLQIAGSPENNLIQRRPPSYRPFVPLDLRGTAPDRVDCLPLRQVLIGPHIRLDNEKILLREILQEQGFSEPLTEIRDASCPLQ